MNIVLLGIPLHRPSRADLIETMTISLAVAALVTILAFTGTIPSSEALVWFAGIVSGAMLAGAGADVRRYGWSAIALLLPVMVISMGLTALATGTS